MFSSLRRGRVRLWGRLFRPSEKLTAVSWNSCGPASLNSRSSSRRKQILLLHSQTNRRRTGGELRRKPLKRSSSLHRSSDTWKLISSVITWLHLKKKINKIPSLSFLNFALFPLTSHRLDRICSEQCLEICITSTSCVCLPLYNVSLIVFLNYKLLWIKESAKCNVSHVSYIIYG